MTSAEHSTLVFLCQAIAAVPEKAQDLIALANKGTLSGDYAAILKRLQHTLNTYPDELIRTCQTIRLVLKTT